MPIQNVEYPPFKNENYSKMTFPYKINSRQFFKDDKGRYYQLIYLYRKICNVEIDPQKKPSNYFVLRYPPPITNNNNALGSSPPNIQNLKLIISHKYDKSNAHVPQFFRTAIKNSFRSYDADCLILRENTSIQAIRNFLNNSNLLIIVGHGIIDWLDENNHRTYLPKIVVDPFQIREQYLKENQQKILNTIKDQFHENVNMLQDGARRFLRVIRVSLQENATIVFWVCNICEHKEGLSLIQTIANYTNKKVLAHDGKFAYTFHYTTRNKTINLDYLTIGWRRNVQWRLAKPEPRPKRPTQQSK
ncbi:MAG: hypothetical protein DRZ80_04470 [Thermoprotei archaeon]|nr:MAG: hypothetical protein DRZ80_04470 [Thermoprotei archaeon]